MALQVVKNSSTGTMGINAARRSRYEKLEVAYGKVPAASYANGDTLQFAEAPSRSIVYARFVSGAGDVLEIFSGTNVAAPIAWTLAGGAVADINYIIEYIRGSGKAHTGEANSIAEVSSEYGVLIQLTVSHS